MSKRIEYIIHLAPVAGMLVLQMCFIHAVRSPRKRILDWAVYYAAENVSV